jgi:hypothetical protein
VIVAGLALLAGCSGGGDAPEVVSVATTEATTTTEVPSVIDEIVLQDEIDSLFAEVSVALSEVRCPSEVEIESGGTFQCTAVTTEGLSLPVEVTMTDNEGTVDIAAGKDVLLVTDEEVDQAAQVLADELGGTVTVECPRVQIVTDATGSIVCDGSTSTGLTGTVTLTYVNNRLTGVE